MNFYIIFYVMFQMILSTKFRRSDFIEIWTCCFCETDYFSSFFDWSEHLRLRHIIGNDSFYCIQHGKAFRFLFELVQHFWSAHLDIFYVCENCHNILLSMNDILCHLEHCCFYLPRCIDCDLIPCVCAFE